jgi:hypothetical protein
VSLSSLNSKMTNVVKKGQEGINLQIDAIISCIPYHLHGLSTIMSSWLRQLTASSCESTGFLFFQWKSFRWLAGFLLSPLNYRERRFLVVNERFSRSPKPPKPEIISFA